MCDKVSKMQKVDRVNSLGTSLASIPNSQQRLRFWYASHGDQLVGCKSLHEFESLRMGSIPTVTPIDKVLEEGNCGEATNRGEEACECLMRKWSSFTFSSKLRGYQQKRDTRPVWSGKWANHHEGPNFEDGEQLQLSLSRVILPRPRSTSAARGDQRALRSRCPMTSA